MTARLSRLRRRFIGTTDAELAVPLSNLSNVYRQQRKLAKAQEVCDRALLLAPRDPAGFARAHVLATCGAIASQRGDLDKAEDLLAEASSLAVILATSQAALSAQIHHSYAVVWRSRRKPGLALSLAWKAHSLVERVYSLNAYAERTSKRFLPVRSC